MAFKAPNGRRLVCSLTGLVILSSLNPALAQDRIRINGSGSCLDLLKPLIQAFEAANPAVRIEMEKPLGSSGGIKALLAGKLDLVASSKSLKPEERARGAQSRDFGRMPLAIVARMEVPKTDLTTQELEGIYALRVTTWPDGRPIRLVLRPEGDADTIVLRSFSGAMDRAMTIARRQEGMIAAVTDPEAIEAIERAPGGFGVSGLPSLIVGKPRLKVLSFNGVLPTKDSLASGAYPLAKDLVFVTADKPPAPVRSFLEFVYSPKGRSIAEATGLQVTAK